MPRLKVVEAHLNQLGYSNTWKLQRNTQLPERPELDQDQLQNILQNTKFPICQNIDVIVPQKPRTQSQELKLRRFLNVIGDPCEKQPGAARQEVSPVRHDSFVRDDDRRAYEIEHFISTEENYVQKLRALVNSIALPLRAQAHSRNPILNSFKHATIFINCDQLLEVNEVFLAELKQLNNSTSDDCFGDVCARNMNAFDCYRKYLSGKRGSEELQKKEYAENQAFRSFIVRAKEDPRAKALEGTLSALLMEPVQRISRYTLQLGVIIKYTPKTHPDWIGLTKAHAKFDEIAKMVEDDLTKLANMLHNLYTSIKDSPCSLINQSRSLVTHLDATEIHRETLKPIRPVTLFLFTDKLMVASRHSHQTKSMEVCGMNDDKSSTSGSFIPKKLERIRPNQMLRFKGWADVEQVELFEGIQDRPDSFLLRVSSAQEQQPQDQQCSDSTAYFQKCARLFAAIPPKESRTSLEASYVETCQEFIASFQKTQALSRRYEPTDETFSRSWQGLDVYSSFYTPNSYKTAKYRNNIAIAYVEEGSDIEIESLISQVNTPWIIGLVQSDTKGYRLSLSSKINLAERDLDRAASGSDNGNKENNEFVSVFWYNGELKVTLFSL
ncbi:Dbl homology domain-containing protein [Phycomyces blakesleeanus]|uniref:Dbl homology domain-containing protein n=1 Tax=Phycomyces blakesleeanus TaxID=4837 RepID=A0ABR3AJY6_PHYBL